MRTLARQRGEIKNSLPKKEGMDPDVDDDDDDDGREVVMKTQTRGV